MMLNEEQLELWNHCVQTVRCQQLVREKSARATVHVSLATENELVLETFQMASAIVKQSAPATGLTSTFIVQVFAQRSGY